MGAMVLLSTKGRFEARRPIGPGAFRRLAAGRDGSTWRQAAAQRQAMSGLDNPNSTAMRCLFFASPR